MNGRGRDTERERVRGCDRSNGRWTMVRYRKNVDFRPHQSNFQELDRIATTFFVSNIPDGWAESDLWRLLSEYGRLGDFYLAKKKDKFGTNIGFARFINVQDAYKMETSLNRITVGNSVLQVNLAKYGRDKKSSSENNNRGPAIGGSINWQANQSGIPQFHSIINQASNKNSGVPQKIEKNFRGNRNTWEEFGNQAKSFVDILKGESSNTIDNVTIPANIQPRSTIWLKSCLIGEAKDYECLEDGEEESEDGEIIGESEEDIPFETEKIGHARVEDDHGENDCNRTSNRKGEDKPHEYEHIAEIQRNAKLMTNNQEGGNEANALDPLSEDGNRMAV
ncbi:hypothetical protein L1887_23059 [Cichorium endivia]|nr:hypothetical protein L1887_23059 [Cichorium endivia]